MVVRESVPARGPRDTLARAEALSEEVGERETESQEDAEGEGDGQLGEALWERCPDTLREAVVEAELEACDTVALLDCVTDFVYEAHPEEVADFEGEPVEESERVKGVK